MSGLIVPPPPLTTLYYGPKQHGTSKGHSQPFLGCCGTVVWWLQAPHAYKPEEVVRTKQIVREDLEKLANYWHPTKSIAEVVLNDVQKSLYEETLLSFGFKPSWGPVKNVNTSRLLYGYFFDLNVYREKKMSEMSRSQLKRA